MCSESMREKIQSNAKVSSITEMTALSLTELDITSEKITGYQVATDVQLVMGKI